MQSNKKHQVSSSLSLSQLLNETLEVLEKMKAGHPYDSVILTSDISVKLQSLKNQIGLKSVMELITEVVNIRDNYQAPANASSILDVRRLLNKLIEDIIKFFGSKESPRKIARTEQEFFARINNAVATEIKVLQNKRTDLIQSLIDAPSPATQTSLELTQLEDSIKWVEAQQINPICDVSEIRTLLLKLHAVSQLKTSSNDMKASSIRLKSDIEQIQKEFYEIYKKLSTPDLKASKSALKIKKQSQEEFFAAINSCVVTATEKTEIEILRNKQKELSKSLKDDSWEENPSATPELIQLREQIEWLEAQQKNPICNVFDMETLLKKLLNIAQSKISLSEAGILANRLIDSISKICEAFSEIYERLLKIERLSRMKKTNADKSLTDFFSMHSSSDNVSLATIYSSNEKNPKPPVKEGHLEKQLIVSNTLSATPDLKVFLERARFFSEKKKKEDELSFEKSLESIESYPPLVTPRDRVLSSLFQTRSLISEEEKEVNREFWGEEEPLFENKGLFEKQSTVEKLQNGIHLDKNFSALVNQCWDEGLKCLKLQILSHQSKEASIALLTQLKTHEIKTLDDINLLISDLSYFKKTRLHPEPKKSSFFNTDTLNAYILTDALLMILVNHIITVSRSFISKDNTRHDLPTFLFTMRLFQIRDAEIKPFKQEEDSPVIIESTQKRGSKK